MTFMCYILVTCSNRIFFPTGDELIYLDPHTTQMSVEPSDSGDIVDDSFHCQHPPCRMHVTEIDPSIAVVSDPLAHKPMGTLLLALTTVLFCILGILLQY